MSGVTRETVAERAGWRCEYCLFREDDDVDFFHVEHIVARKHGGANDLANLAFACPHCNFHKGPCLSGIDPEGEPDLPVRLFHPRNDAWGDHFRFDGPSIRGVTPVGRATVACLNLNAEQRLLVRVLNGYTDKFE